MEQHDYIIWFCTETRIASFHSVEGYEQRTFTSREFFMGFLQSLQMQGYRFQ